MRNDGYIELAQEIERDAECGEEKCEHCESIATTVGLLLEALQEGDCLPKYVEELKADKSRLLAEVERLRETVKVAKMMLEVTK